MLKIDHIGIAVKSLQESKKIYGEFLGLKSISEEEIPEQKVKVISFSIGESQIELLEPTSEDSPIANFLNKRGEGIHHLAFYVENIEAELKTLEEKGVTLIDKKPRLGAHNKKIAFVHPKSTGGVLIELCSK